jgi:alpha/beta superfamily hydrolase
MYERFAAPKQLHWIESADHFFAGGLEALEEQVKAVAEPRP